MGPCPFRSDVPRGRTANPRTKGGRDAVGDLDLPREPVRLHAARRVHGVAPEVVDESAPADHACHHRSRVDPDPDREPALSGPLADRRDLVPRRKRQAGDRFEWSGRGSGNPRATI